jgi:hypothetical protein
MKKDKQNGWEYLRKYKDNHRHHPPKRDPKWCIEQYNRNRSFKEHKTLEDSPLNVHHPTHYGGKDNPYESIKVIEDWGLNFNLGNAVKYISRAGKKQNKKEDLEKAYWYINRELQNL